jgi:hypothetical protein
VTSCEVGVGRGAVGRGSWRGPAAASDVLDSIDEIWCEQMKNVVRSVFCVRRAHVHTIMQNTSRSQCTWLPSPGGTNDSGLPLSTPHLPGKSGKLQRHLRKVLCTCISRSNADATIANHHQFHMVDPWRPGPGHQLSRPPASPTRKSQSIKSNTTRSLVI